MSNDNGRLKVGLALGGGVARGLAHIGVLAVLEEAGIPIDCIAGTSMGSIIGAAYCAGLTVDDLREIAATTGWYHVSRPLPSLNGLIRFNKLQEWVDNNIGRYDIRDLAVPFAAVASDLRYSERVILWRGPLGSAIQASCSVPGFVSPVERDGRFLVDGGMTDNVPADVVRMLGADYVIGVDVFTAAFRPVLGPFSHGLAALETLIRHAGLGERDCDCLIVPELQGFSYLRFTDHKTLIAVGEEAARKQLPVILDDLQKREAARQQLLSTT